MKTDKEKIIEVCEGLGLPSELIDELVLSLDDPKRESTKNPVDGSLPSLEERILNEEDWKKKTALIAMRISRDIESSL